MVMLAALANSAADPFVSVEHPVAQIRQRAVRRRVGGKDHSQAEQRCGNFRSRGDAPQGDDPGQNGSEYAHQSLCH